MGRVVDTFAYIRDYYGIAVTKGMHVEDSKGRKGVAVKGSNYVHVQREGERGTVPYHPQALRYPALNYVGAEIRESEGRAARGEASEPQQTSQSQSQPPRED